MLEQFMDESYFQPIFHDATLNKIPSADQTPDLSGIGRSNNAHHSSHSSYDIFVKPLVQNEKLTASRSQETIEPMSPRVRSDAHEDCPLNDIKPFTVTHYERSPPSPPAIVKAPKATRPSLSRTYSDEWATEPQTSMSVYEKLAGCRRSSPTAQEKERDRLAFLQYAAFPARNTNLHSTRLSSRNGGRHFEDPFSHAIPLLKPIGFYIVGPPSSKNFYWIPVVPCSENFRHVTKGEAGDWDFSEIRDSECKDVLVRGRYREGMKGFLRLN
ncbi:MAG: hypothetical protein Q9221_004541 [Calogaya cf. arnoldii]